MTATLPAPPQSAAELVTAQAPPEPAPLTGVQKAAIVLIVIGDQASAELLRKMNEEEVQAVTREVTRMKNITTEQTEGVLEEFFQLTAAHEFVIKGGLDYARSMLVSAFGNDTGKKLVDRMNKTMGPDIANFDVLQNADPQQLAKYLHNEHPQTIALVLSHLSAAQAATLLASLTPEMRSDVALRIASLDQISPEVMTRIAAVIAQKLKGLNQISRESFGGVRVVAELCNRLDADTCKDVLAAMEEEEPALVENIRHLMFVFDDILNVDQSGIKEVLARIDRKVLTMALKGTGEELRNHFLGCMSQRGAEMLREDMEALGPVKIKDVEAAQQQIIGVLRQLESQGVLSIGGGAGDQYVV
jgi:flagellar motor switch protein FliG